MLLRDQTCLKDIRGTSPWTFLGKARHVEILIIFRRYFDFVISQVSFSSARVSGPGFPSLNAGGCI
jgi:hypothetical protein